MTTEEIERLVEGNRQIVSDLVLKDIEKMAIIIGDSLKLIDRNKVLTFVYLQQFMVETLLGTIEACIESAKMLGITTGEHEMRGQMCNYIKSGLDIYYKAQEPAQAKAN